MICCRLSGQERLPDAGAFMDTYFAFVAEVICGELVGLFSPRQIAMIEWRCAQ